MSKRRLFRDIAIGFAGLVVVLLVAIVIVVQTGWFRNYAKREIVSLTEDATGGKVELDNFDFDPWHLRAVVIGFTIHGTEPAGAAPFLRVEKAEVEVRLLPGLRHLYEIVYFGVQKPRINVIQLADGRTNIPSPKQKSTSNTSALETVVDLAVRRFELTDGLATVESRRQPLNIRGNNLSAQLSWNPAMQGYQGRLSIEPLYVASGRNTPIHFTLTLPVSLQRDRIDIRNGAISTPVSTIALNLSLENMRNPKFSGHIGGHIALADVQNLANVPLAQGRGIAQYIDLDVNATASNDLIEVTGLRASMGQSDIEASGALKKPGGGSSLAFKAQISLSEVGRLLKISSQPEGLMLINGNASLDAANNYLATGNIETRNLSFREGTRRFRDISVLSAFHVDPHTIDLNGFRLTGFGGELTADASLQDFERYKVDGILRNLDIERALRAAGEPLPYDGVISGTISAEGDTKVPGTKSMAGRAMLSITPGRRGIPVSGRLNANYSGAADRVTISDSYLNLPHTRISVNGVSLNGSADNRLNVSLTSRDLNDLLAATSPKGPPPMALNGGELTLNAVVTGGFADPRITGHLAANRFSVEGRQFDSLSADLAAASSRVSISNASVMRGAMQMQLTAAAGLKHWSPAPYEPLTANVSIANGDLADVIAMAGQQPEGFSGALSAEAHVSGTIGNPQGSANLQVGNGTIEGEVFNQIHAEVNLTDRQATIPAAYIEAPAGRVDLKAEFTHPPDRFTTGQLHAHLGSTPIDLAAVRRIREERPSLSGAVQVNADVTGNLDSGTARNSSSSEFVPTNVTADLSGRGLKLRDLDYGNLNLTARTSGQTLTYNLTDSLTAANIQLSGNTRLVTDYPTTADANINGYSIDHLLVLANRRDIPAGGILSGTAHFNGTVRNPNGGIDLNLSRAVIYDEPIDSARATVSYLERSIEISRLEVVSGPARIAMTGRYDHPADNLREGNARFEITSSAIDLSRFRNVQKMSPGFGGVLQISASGAGQVREGNPRILLSSLDARLAASGIKAQGANLGDLTLTANTSSSSQLIFALESNLGGSSIHAGGSAGLTGDYPVNAELMFSNVLYTRLLPLLGATGATGGATIGKPEFEAATDGEVTVNGPVFKTDQLRGSLRLTRLSLTTTPRPGAGKPITIANKGPISATLDRGLVRIQSAHISGAETDISASGTASITGQPLDVTVNATADLGILPNFDQDIYAAGKITAAATIRGSASAPLINGQMALNNASLNYTGITNGISNANGTIVFNGNSATIRNLTAESGGGKIMVSGFVGYANGVRFGITSSANGVRVRAEQGVSITAAADVRLQGTMQNSSVSGTITLSQLIYNPQSDIGSMLSRAAPPVQSPSAPSPLLDNMKLEISVKSASGLAVQASLAQNLQADVDLRVRGTASQPAVLGRITINQGQLVFFGASYTVSNGTIAFYNPVRIEPVLDIALETEAQGVHVTLRVTGPIDNMKLSYTSDPPLQFQEIVSLLAAGKTPTSDPTLLANQPQTPQQSFQQMGESAIMSKALTDPVSSRLERVFGVTQLKIDPAFQAGSQLPTARLTLQQQITSNLTFTYTSALDDPNGQIIRIEWAFNRRFSAIANRDQNGIFSINFFYKRRFQ